MVRLEGVGLRYGPEGAAGRDALVGLNLVVPQAGFAWVVGPTGAGKTALLDILGLSIAATRGRVVLLDRDVAAFSRAERAAMRRRIGRIHATPHLLDAMTVFDSVALPMRLDARPEASLRADVGELLGWLGLADRARQPVGALGLGERHLVAIARAVAAQPELLLADEPTAQLDPTLAEQVMRLLWELHLLGATVLVATHDPAWPKWQAASTVRLAHGRRVEHA